MLRFRAAIFDFDGTLADTGPWLKHIINDVADRHGFRRLDDGEIVTLRGRSHREIIGYLGLKLWQIPAIARDMRRRSAENAEEFRLFEGIPELLGSLKAAGMQVAVVSSNGEETIRRVLGPSARHVDHFGAGASLFGKAAKFRSVRRRFYLSGGEVVAIGDEVRDVEAAKAAGFTSVGVTWGFASERALLDAGPDVIARTAAELSAICLAAQPAGSSA